MKNLFPELTRTELATGFGCKVLMGILYGYIFLHYFPGDDTLLLHYNSIEETKLLLNNPLLFFQNEFTPVHALADGNNLPEIILLYLNDLEYALVVKTMAIMNLLSQGNYYINVLFFNIMAFFGHYWLFRSMTALFPEKRRLMFRGIFLFLPAVFWLSGYRSDGWLFFFFSLLLFNLVVPGRRRRIWGLIIGFPGVLIIRQPFALLLALAIAGYFAAVRIKRHPLIIFTATYLIAAILFFTSTLLLPGDGFPGAMAKKQHSFLSLEGTTLKLDSLHPDIKSYATVLPQAFGNTFLRPFPWEANGALQLFYAAEIAAFWIIILFALFKRDEDWKMRLSHPVILMLLFFSVSVYINIGYIVPFPGAIGRYKIIPELLILCCFLTIVKNKHSNIK